ncbi:hypothetical protein [Vagococcus humatus]|uniref:Uncharacterized protein n=1 Tax=Vagococcus humatus TaxID=1889241 RepID=A0A3S0A6R3_9ENTE|nr:hypothetical protein [Vagococcus humatus]RST90195.1 hypothetical protein C7P63_03725 [Vagococcus humatus]
MMQGVLVLLSVLIGAGIALGGTFFYQRKMFQEFARTEQIKEKMKEIDTLILLNKKIHEILAKRDGTVELDTYLEKYQSFVNFDDVQITIDDYIYLQSFCAQNHYYLPNYLVDEFFKEISHRKIVLDPQDIRRLGAYTYQGGRLVLENFSDELQKCIEDQKIELNQLKK